MKITRKVMVLAFAVNAAVAVVAAPVFYHALRPALRSAGMWEKLRA